MPYLLKFWHERLFGVQRSKVTLKKSSLSISMIPITEKNIDLVSELRGAEYKSQFKHQLSLGDFGYYAYLGDKPVGYGWVKHAGSDDYFYKINNGCCYLCRFFVHESMRGHGIYPAIISALIEHEDNCNCFYINVERGNVSSERGLSKVGFEFIDEYTFIRALGYTLNKKTLKGRIII